MLFAGKRKRIKTTSKIGANSKRAKIHAAQMIFGSVAKRNFDGATVLVEFEHTRAHEKDHRDLGKAQHSHERSLFEEHRIVSLS